MKLHKILLIAITAFLLPFLGFIFLLKSQIGEISLQNYLAHSALLIIACALAFYVSYRAYRAYNKNKDYRVFFIALAFYIYGFGFLIHAITVPGFKFVNEGVFDFTEHFSLFFGSLIMLGLVLPFQGLNDWLFRHRKGLVFELIMLSVLIFIFLPVGFPARINNFSHYIDFTVVAPTGLLLLITLSFLIKKYRETVGELLFYLIVGFAVLINAAIIPLFYEEWGVLWWYFHFIFILGFTIILMGLFASQRFKQDFETAFGAVPLYAKIKGKLIAFILLISILPLIASVYFVFTSLKNNLQKQIANDLILVAESQEGQIFTYLETKKGRAIDFASDGFIRDAVQTIAGNPEKSASTTEALNRHLRTNKMPLDKAVYGINVIDLNGKIIASTDDAEIGKDEKADSYFIDTLNLAYRSAAVVSDMEVSRHFFPNKQSIMISAPLTDKNTNEKIGIMINYYDISELNRFISGARQVELGALSGLKGREKTLDIYLVNKDKLMITASKFFGDEVFLKQVVNTEPVFACHSPQPKEISGAWKNYRNTPVYGASMCLTGLNWTLLVEIDQQEVLQSLIATRNAITIVIIFITSLIIILAVYFSKSITQPLESLTIAAGKISRGDLSVQANANSNNEIGMLAKSFNAMVKNLLEIREYPEKIIGSMADSLFLLDTDGKIKEANKAASCLTGYGSNELIGQSFSIITDADYKVCMGTDLAQNKELLYKSKSGEEIPISASCSIIENDKKEITGIIVVGKDMREYQTAQNRIKASEQQLRAANQQLNAGNQQLAASQKNLQDKLLELERFNKIAVGRELKMVELKQDIAELKKRLGEE